MVLARPPVDPEIERGAHGRMFLYKWNPFRYHKRLSTATNKRLLRGRRNPAVNVSCIRSGASQTNLDARGDPHPRAALAARVMETGLLG
jgi:hypothetical protein